MTFQQGATPQIGIPVTPLTGQGGEFGIGPAAQVVVKMSATEKIWKYDVVQINLNSPDANLRWTAANGLRGKAAATLPDTNVYGVALDDVGVAGGVYRCGIIGDFPVNCVSSITNSASSTNSINGVRLKAHTTGVTNASAYTHTHTSVNSISTQQSNWLFPVGSASSAISSNYTWNLNHGAKILGIIVSSNSLTAGTGATYYGSLANTQLVRFNGWGLGNAEL